jgi:GNAT superfamily N-acetyltransferase
MLIREARSDEYDRLRDLMVAAYEEYGAMMPPEAWNEYEADIRDIESRSAFGELLVADEGGALVGAVTYYLPSSGGGEAEHWPGGWPGIRLLAVPPDQRGNGYGRALTQACIDRARRDAAPGIALGTTELMKVARDMYERIGFVHHPEYDWDPVPGITVTIYLLAFE